MKLPHTTVSLLVEMPIFRCIKLARWEPNIPRQEAATNEGNPLDRKLESQTSALRIGILHTRWNTPIVSALVNGAVSSLTNAGVPRDNIILQSVPGSYELPFAVQRMYTASQTTSASSLVSAATDLLGGSGSATDLMAGGGAAPGSGKGPLDAIIAIGVLIKGSTMHFEYISDAVSHGLMRVQLDSGCPVIFGVLTCLTEDQACERAGLPGPNGSKSAAAHNHAEDWGSAAVEMGLKRKDWGEGKFAD